MKRPANAPLFRLTVGFPPVLNFVLVASLALGLSACATLDHYEPETAIVPPQAYARDLPPSGIAENWWEGFGDPVLDGLVEEGRRLCVQAEASP